MNTGDVDSYLRDGCGRCDKYQTPECKVHDWSEPLKALRELVGQTELAEEMKWGSPCYTLDGKNVVMIAAFKDYCALSFFQGAALDDDDGLLERPGPNSRYGRLLKFTSLAASRRSWPRKATTRGRVKRPVDQKMAALASRPRARRADRSIPKAAGVHRHPLHLGALPPRSSGQPPCVDSTEGSWTSW